MKSPTTKVLCARCDIKLPNKAQEGDLCSDCQEVLEDIEAIESGKDVNTPLPGEWGWSPTLKKVRFLDKSGTPKIRCTCGNLMSVQAKECMKCFNRRRLKRGLALNPHYGPTCRFCGGKKTLTAFKCLACNRRERAGKLHVPGQVCPNCGQRKPILADLCRGCASVPPEKLLFRSDTCPKCKGPKIPRSWQCRSCLRREKHEAHLAHFICPKCGGPKKNQCSKQCLACAAAAHSIFMRRRGVAVA